jgi:hypothetical protein
MNVDSSSEDSGSPQSTSFHEAPDAFPSILLTDPPPTEGITPASSWEPIITSSPPKRLIIAPPKKITLLPACEAIKYSPTKRIIIKNTITAEPAMIRME